MRKTEEGSTNQLLQLCGGYFFFYTIYSVANKYFIAKPTKSMTEIEFTVYSTIGGSLLCLIVVLALGWYRLESNRRINIAGMSLPSELLYIIPSGICTAVIVPTTTLMYSLPISVMVAMVIMRGSVIVIGRVVDGIQIKQGILQKKVFWEENVAVLCAVVAVAVALIENMLSGKGVASSGGYLSMNAGYIILASYILAYSIRIYIMNFYKNTRGKGVKQDNKGFFAIEQIVTSIGLLFTFIAIFYLPGVFGLTSPLLTQFNGALVTPRDNWLSAVGAGTIFGTVSFFSVFLFMFKGRTATFSGLVNRLTSLIAGTAATLIFWLGFGGSATKRSDWIALGFILLAVAFLTRAEKRRSLEGTPAPKSPSDILAAEGAVTAPRALQAGGE